MADLIAIKPSDQVLMEVVFEPISVTLRSWILYINFIFLIISRKDQTLSHLTESFRHNIRLALDDAKIFLEPNEVNVQALAMLSCLGEDYTSPDLSWMLANHACRQAQALNLHLTEQHYSTEQQRRLTLFWVLFMVDKACALAFGHPVLLSSKMYENVPLPDFQHLLKFRPRHGQMNNTHTQPYTSTFGAHFLTQNIKLARLTGLILDILTNGALHGGRESLMPYLDDWDMSTRQVLSEARALEADHAGEEQLRGMSLAIRLMRFKYLHILVLTLPEDVQYTTLRLESAREALSLLPHLSSKHHVYRGIFWTLLYYPFTSFFVIFNHITRYPEAPTTNEDFDLLYTTLSYFQSMKVKLRRQSVVPSELEQIVESFIQCARSAVSKDISDYTQ
ncbi:fungal-specific transcription factor domain-containing protein [Trichoderma velutinum]